MTWLGGSCAGSASPVRPQLDGSGRRIPTTTPAEESHHRSQGGSSVRPADSSDGSSSRRPRPALGGRPHLRLGPRRILQCGVRHRRLQSEDRRPSGGRKRADRPRARHPQNAALARGDSVSGPIHHSDRGVHSRANRHIKQLAEAAAFGSVGACGDLHVTKSPRGSMGGTEARSSITPSHGDHFHAGTAAVVAIWPAATCRQPSSRRPTMSAHWRPPSVA